MSIKVLPTSVFEFPASVTVCTLAVGVPEAPGEEVDRELLETLPIPNDLLQATSARQFEYRCGRLAALLALRKCCPDAQPPGRGAQGQPLWPKGLRGSITHTDRFVAAAATSSQEIQALGIDAETILPLERILTITEAALGKSEVELLSRKFPAPEKKAEILLGVISAKESILKCLFAQWQALDFIDLELLDISTLTGNSFHLMFQCNKQRRPRILSWFAYDHERVYSCAILSRIS